MSRIDRIYMSQAPEETRSLMPVTMALGSLLEMERISDHIAIRVQLSHFNARSPFPSPIPPWVAKHPEFRRVLYEVCEPLRLCPYHWFVVDSFRSLVHVARTRFLREKMASTLCPNDEKYIG